MTKVRRSPESFILTLIIAMSGGFMDAYSYMERGEVFANAQTGNLIMLGINISTGNFGVVLNYLTPVLSFLFGIVMALLIRHAFKNMKLVHWRQITALFEGLVLIGVAFIPHSQDMTANFLISFVCGVQVQSFRKVNGVNIATIMCMGNMRTATHLVFQYFYKKDKELLKSGIMIYTIILFFVIGAIIGNFFGIHLGNYAIIISGGIMILSSVLMFWK